ncbi:VOC family protein [Shewanella sp. 10N.286.45.A1]|uniref:VOC family protein n=1 Tax=Shewanella sp. 10N.286.45.A1 TaxID=3229694 RepID=UPI00354D8229
MKISSYQQGQPCWVELASTDAASARHFYAVLFDLGLNDMPISEGVYTMFTIDGDDIGAMYQMPAEMSEQGTPTHWGGYFAVAKATELGGQVCVPPTDIESVGRFSVINDPQGGVFSVITLSPQAAP